MVNINELYEQYAANPIKWMEQNNCVTTKDITVLLMKEAIKQAIPIILKEVSEKATLIEDYDSAFTEPRKDFGTLYTDNSSVFIDKDSILSLEQELIQKLLKQ